MADQVSNDKATMETMFRIGGIDKPGIKNSSNTALEARNGADSDYETLRADYLAASPGLNDVPVFRDLKARIPNIEFTFAGASPPSPGDNTEKFGFCHTTGGGYTAGDVVYDPGSIALIKIPATLVTTVTTALAISGSISMIEDGIYVNEGGTWVLKGDGGGVDTGYIRSIEVAYAYTDSTVSSTTSIPVGARVTKVMNAVDVAFNGSAPTLLVQIDGDNDTTILATTKSDLKNAAQYYSNEKFAIAADYNGVVKLTVTPNGSSAGSGSVIVEYTTPGA